MMCLIDLQQGEINGFIIGNDTFEIRRKFEAIFNYSDDYRRQQCIQHLYRLDFPKQGKMNLDGGYILLVE